MTNKAQKDFDSFFAASKKIAVTKPDQPTPAQRSVQEIAREAAVAYLCQYQAFDGDDRDELTAIITRAIAEAVKTVDARIESSVRDDLYEASRIVRASASGPGFADTFCLANRVGFIADALAELRRATE